MTGLCHHRATAPVQNVQKRESFYISFFLSSYMADKIV